MFIRRQKCFQVRLLWTHLRFWGQRFKTLVTFYIFKSNIKRSELLGDALASPTRRGRIESSKKQQKSSTISDGARPGAAPDAGGHRYDLWFPLNLERVAERVWCPSLFPLFKTRYLCFGVIFQIPLDWLQWIQISCVQVVQTHREQLPSRPVTVWRRPSCETWTEVRTDTQVVLMLDLDLDLSLTHWEPHHIRLMDRNSGLFPGFLTSPRQSCCPFYFTGVCSSTFLLVVTWRDICLLSLTSGLSSRLTYIQVLYIFLCGFVRAGLSAFYHQ